MPKQKPGKSKQDVATPRWLLRIVGRTWGDILLDVCADYSNTAAELFFDKAKNGLEQDWAVVRAEAGGKFVLGRSYFEVPGSVWCNPPYGKIKPWTKKAAEGACSNPVVMLVPASVGSNWWAEYVHGQAQVYFIRPRLKFVGHKQGFPKDLALVVYGAGAAGYWTAKLDEKTETMTTEAIAGGNQAAA